MATIRYSDGDSPEAELSATSAEFARLAASILALGESETTKDFMAVAVGRSSEPYRRCLTALRVAKAGGLLMVSVVGDSLLVSGGPTSLGLFARNIPLEPTLHPGYHVHFDCVGREDAVSPQSIPLILVVEDGRDT